MLYGGAPYWAVFSVLPSTVCCHVPFNTHDVYHFIEWPTSFTTRSTAIQRKLCSAWCVHIVGETVRYHGRLPAQRLHPGTAHVHGYHGAELVATDALSPGDTGGDPPQSGVAGKCLSLLPDLRARNGRSAIWWRYLNSVIRSEDKRKMFPSFLFYTIQVGIWQLTHLVVGDQVLVNLKVWIHHWWRSPCYSSLSFALLSLLFSAVNLTLHFNCFAPSHRRGSTANHCASRPIWLATATWRSVTWPVTWRPTASTWWCLRFYSTSSGHFRCR